MKGWKIDPYDGITVLQLLDELTDHLDSDDAGQLRCCDAPYPEVVNAFDRQNRYLICAHQTDCPWMRAHAILNKSTDHGYSVHEWASDE